MKEKLDVKLDTDQITQTRSKRPTIPFRDSAVDKITKTNTEFGNRQVKEFKFDVPKGSSLKGLQLRFYRNTGVKNFVLSIWINQRNEYYIVGAYPNIRCKDVEKICLGLADTHQDERGLWIKSPVKTRVDEKRLIDKPDTTLTAGKSLNDVIEDYCKGGFEKDNKVGRRTSKSCQIWLRYMAGYNNRQLLVEFEDDSNGEAIMIKSRYS
jgi:hypothetical protein